MWALSDRGFLTEARVLRDQRGRLTGAERIRNVPLRNAGGDRLTGGGGDSEGLDWDGGDSLTISFEGRQSRVMRYTLGGRPLDELPRDPSWTSMHANERLEAMAIDAEGVVHVIAEAPSSQGFAVQALDGAGWSVRGYLPNDGSFRPVGADFGPDGALYVLERKNRLAFFASRISRVTFGARFRHRVLLETIYGTMDNHEGLCVTRDRRDRLWATTISDDNQNAFQRTELAEFRLPD